MTIRRRSLRGAALWGVAPAAALAVGVTAVATSAHHSSQDRTQQAAAAHSAAPKSADKAGGSEGKGADEELEARSAARRPGHRHGPGHGPGHGHDHGHRPAQNRPRVHHVSLSISPEGDGAQSNIQFASDYQRAIDGLRQETGPVLRDYVRTTQPDNRDLIRLRVYRDGSQPVDLFFSASDLYLHAWATHNGDDPEQGTLFEFGDRHIGPLLGWNHRQVVHTGIPGGYIGLERTAAYGRNPDDPNNPNRHNVEYGRPGLWRAFSDLDNADGRYRMNRQGAPDPTAGAPTRNDLARSLITVITATSEAARFRPVASDIRNAVHYNRPTTMDQQNLDLIQDWDLVSQYMLNVTQNPHAQPSEHIDPEIRRHLHSFQAGQGYLAVVHKKSSK